MKRKIVNTFKKNTDRHGKTGKCYNLDKSYITQACEALKYSIENELVSQVKEILQTNKFVTYPNSVPKFKGTKKFKAVKEIDWSRVYLDNEIRDNCLHYATRLGKACLIDIILETGNIDINSRNPNDDQNTALCIACDAGWLDVAKILISRGADVNFENAKLKTPLILATELIFPYDYQMANLLVSNKAIVNYRTKNGNTALLSASKFGNTELMNMLIKSNANVNSKFSDGATPLMRACYYNYLSMVEILLENSAQIEERNLRNETALYIASFRGYLDIVRLLVTKYKANVNSEDVDGDTPLSVACYEDKPHIVNYLLSNGGLVNKKGIRGDTPLHIAVANCSNKVVQMLLKNGANPNEINNDMETPLHIAVRHNHADILETLIKVTQNLDQCSIFNSKTAWKYLMESLSVDKLKMAVTMVKAGCDVNKGFSGLIKDVGYNIYTDSPFEYIFKLPKSKFRVIQQISLYGEIGLRDGIGGLSETAIISVTSLVNLIIKSGYKVSGNDIKLYENSWLKEYLNKNGIKFGQINSLMGICRSRIRQLIHKPIEISIPKLDLPDNLKLYLNFL